MYTLIYDSIPMQILFNRDTRQSASIYKALEASKFTHQRLFLVDTVTDVPLPEDFPTFYQSCAKSNADGRKVTS